jgi:hypothetical protein
MPGKVRGLIHPVGESGLNLPKVKRAGLLALLLDEKLHGITSSVDTLANVTSKNKKLFFPLGML